jgi:thiosulfate/3-mercaptopyruvate sulfurtransferase
MSLTSSTRLRPLPAWLIVIVVSLMVSVLPAIAYSDPPAGADVGSPSSTPASASPSAPDQLIQPQDLARLLADTTGQRPVVLHVGPKILFQSGHIPGARHVGPASTPTALVALKQALREVPHQQPIVLYCGCCPWTDCPNVGPALLAAREMGLKNVRLLHLPQNLQHDWIDKGLPIAKGDQ